MQVVPGHRPVAVPVLGQLPGIPHEGRIAREQVGLGPEPLQRPHEGNLGGRLHPLQLLLRRPLLGHPRELLVHLLAQPGKGRFGPGGRHHPGEPTGFERVVKGAHLGRRPVLVDHAPVEPRVQSVGQDLRQHVERRFVFVEERDGGPAAIEARVGHRLGHHDAAVGGSMYLGERRPAGDLAGPNGPEVAAYEFHGAALLVVARNHQDRVVRRVPGTEEVVDLAEVGGGQVGHVADHVPRIGMSRREQRVEHLFPGRSVGNVVHPLEALVPHHFALGVQLGLVENIEEIRHPVRFGPERQAERLPGHRLVVVRPVVARGAVHAARGQARTGPLHEPDEVAVVVAGALEHQVLEQMGEPGAPGLLVLGPHVVPERHVHDRQAAVLVEQHPESVAEGPLLDGDRDIGRHFGGNGPARGCRERRIRHEGPGIYCPFF